jgi:RimJ/RimL family protein N-acetyltransferase
VAALESELDRRRHQRSAAERDRKTRVGSAGLKPPLIYSDGVVTIRRQRLDDLEADLAAKDDEQIRWLWLPGQREQWQAMTRDEQRAHAQRTLTANRDSFGTGSKWCFSVDSTDANYVAYVDFDLANELVPAGDANISYSSHPAYRGRGYVTRAVRLVARFIAEHTDVRRAYLIVDARNTTSLRVAHAVGAVEVGRWVNESERTMIRHELRL